MNKLKKIILSILGGADVVMTVITPIILMVLWISIFGIKGHWTNPVIIIFAGLASLFRAIKIGWIKK